MRQYENHVAVSTFIQKYVKYAYIEYKHIAVFTAHIKMSCDIFVSADF